MLDHVIIPQLTNVQDIYFFYFLVLCCSFSLCFTWDSSYCYVFRFTNLSFWGFYSLLIYLVCFSFEILSFSSLEFTAESFLCPTSPSSCFSLSSCEVTAYLYSCFHGFVGSFHYFCHDWSIFTDIFLLVMGDIFLLFTCLQFILYATGWEFLIIIITTFIIIITYYYLFIFIMITY